MSRRSRHWFCASIMRRVAAIAIGAALCVPPSLAWVTTGSLLLNPAYQSQDETAPDAPAVPIGPLRPGAAFRFELVPSQVPYAALDLLPATWETMPIATWTVCSEHRCLRTRS